MLGSEAKLNEDVRVDSECGREVRVNEILESPIAHFVYAFFLYTPSSCASSSSSFSSPTFLLVTPTSSYLSLTRFELIDNMTTTLTMNAPTVLLEPLPNLKLSTLHTTSHALHLIYYKGNLEPWPNFAAEVAHTYHAQTWSPQIIDSKISGPGAADSTAEEHVFVSSETEVQGRLLGRAGQALGAAFKAQQQGIMFGGFKAAIPPHDDYRKVPDFVAVSQSGIAKAIGEAKVPWVQRHSLSLALKYFEEGNERNFRHVLGKVPR